MSTSGLSIESTESFDYSVQIESYCRSKKWAYSREGEWFRLSKCPICGSEARKPFAINIKTGAGKCHRCGFLGGLSSLKMNQGDMVAAPAQAKKKYTKPPAGLWKEYHDALLSNGVALRYLKEKRFIGIENVNKFKIGFDSKNKRFAFPFFERGELVSIKYKWVNRDTHKKEICRWTGGPGETTRSTLYNVDVLNGVDRAVICEGEEDCIILDSVGVKNVVSVPNGADGCTGEFLDPLERFREIVIVLDGDEAGQRGTQKLCDALGKERCRVVTLPTDIDGAPKDPTDFMRLGKIELVLRAIEESPIFTHDKVAHISESIQELRDDFLYGDRTRGVSTGYPTLDQLVGGRRPGELTVVFGATGSGKSTFCNNLCLNWAAAGEAVLLGSFENTRKSMMRKFAEMITGRWYHERNDTSGSSMTIDEFDKACEVMIELPIFMVNVFGIMDIDEFISCVSYAKRRLNANVAVLDHLHFMLNMKRAEDTNIVIDRAMRKLKTCAVDNYMSIVAVAHPKKADNDTGIYTIQDLKGSSTISQESDNVWLAWRDRKLVNLDPRVGRAKIISLKSRDEAGSEGEVELGFVHAGQRFVDLTAKTTSFKIEPTRTEVIEDVEAPVEDF